MKAITHKQQQEVWDKEHQVPQVLLQMDATSGSSGVVKFWDWLKNTGINPEKLKGIEVCCGKGRNVIWLAKQGISVIGVDFSPAAIKEAQRRTTDERIGSLATFMTQDATLPYKIQPASLDFAIDCFGSTDIESNEGRQAALKNMIRILKPGGYLMVYLLSTDDEFHKEMIEKNPGPDKGSFIHPINGKYEKAFTENEVKRFYKDLILITLERVPKKATFFGKEYNCNHIWAIFQKP